MAAKDSTPSQDARDPRDAQDAWNSWGDEFDGTAGPEDFESGLDYGSAVDDSDTGASRGADTETQPTETVDRPGAETQPTRTIYRPGAEAQATETISPSDPGAQSTQALDRSELDALMDQDGPPDEGPEAISARSTYDPAEDDSSAYWPAGAAAVGTGTAVAGAHPIGASTDDSDDRRREMRDAQARAAARDEALEGSRTGPRVLQVLLAVFLPIVLVIAAVRAVASPLFLWLEYHRPGFPADAYGFTTEDRLTYGSYGMDYLFNTAPPRYLAELQTGGAPLFTESEVSHMADVKLVILITMAVGMVLAVASVIMLVALSRAVKGGIRRALFAGAVWLLLAMVTLAVLAALGWQQFFAAFHSLFFADGTWTFAASDTLIRLYPNQFWIDAGIAVAALVVVVAVITLVCTWPTRRRRLEDREAQADQVRRRTYWAQGE